MYYEGIWLSYSKRLNQHQRYFPQPDQFDDPTIDSIKSPRLPPLIPAPHNSAITVTQSEGKSFRAASLLVTSMDYLHKPRTGLDSYGPPSDVSTRTDCFIRRGVDKNIMNSIH